MALTKEIKIDKIEVIGDLKRIGCRKATTIFEDGVKLTRTMHRYVLDPDADISAETQEVKDICNTVWTDEVKQAFADYRAPLDAAWAANKAQAEKDDPSDL